MKNKKTIYIFQYDKHNNLNYYAEKTTSDKLISYYNYNYTTNSLIRYDPINKLRIFQQFDENCKLVHRFEAGESWIKVVPISMGQHDLAFPKVKKQFALNNDNEVVKFSIPHLIMDRW